MPMNEEEKPSLKDMDLLLEVFFGFFDKNGDGYISRSELKEALDKLGEDFSDDEIEFMIREADTDQDGEIDYKEFARAMTKKDRK